MFVFLFFGIFERYVNNSFCDIGLVEDNIEEYKLVVVIDVL